MLDLTQLIQAETEGRASPHFLSNPSGGDFTEQRKGIVFTLQTQLLHNWSARESRHC